MITLENDSLVFRFPDVHEAAALRIGFQRTLRLPDDGKTYPLPADLGNFPLRHLDDFAARLTSSMAKRGGVLMPMWQAEAMWISFGNGWRSYPCAVKIAAGKINAVTGEAWSIGLNRDPQDYVVAARQPWLDGFCVEKGAIRQFVAAPLGSGTTAEEQLTGAAEHGGVQIVVYPMKKEAYERLLDIQSARLAMFADADAVYCRRLKASDMGLAAGGKMRQEVYEDEHDFEVWDLRNSARCFVTLLNASAWASVTGEAPPTKPISAQTYRQHHIPWFDCYAADKKALEGSTILDGLKGSGEPDADQEPLPPCTPVQLGPDRRPQRRSQMVREFEAGAVATQEVLRETGQAFS
jgi:hypothetical protein